MTAADATGLEIGDWRVAEEVSEWIEIIAINVMGNGVFLVFITLAARVAGDRPDPVPHAMVLTGIIPVRRVFDAVEWPVIVLLGCISYTSSST